MKVAKWGNSLAVRLPSAVVEALELKEGDEVALLPNGEKRFEVVREADRAEKLRRLRELMQGSLPADFKFNRDEANER